METHLDRHSPPPHVQHTTARWPPSSRSTTRVFLLAVAASAFAWSGRVCGLGGRGRRYALIVYLSGIRARILPRSSPAHTHLVPDFDFGVYFIFYCVHCVSLSQFARASVYNICIEEKNEKIRAVTELPADRMVRLTVRVGLGAALGGTHRTRRGGGGGGPAGHGRAAAVGACAVRPRSARKPKRGI